MSDNEIDLIKLIDEGKVKLGDQKINVPIKQPNHADFNGQTYMIPLEYLYYNDQNGRIGTAISRYESEHGSIEPGHNEKYNNAIQGMIYDGDKPKMDELKADIGRKRQEKPGYVLNDGRVIDGNRRFTAVRMLRDDDKVSGAQYFEAVILDGLNVDDNSKDESLVKKLELKIQFGSLEKEDYDPIDKAIDAYKTVDKKALMTAKEYAEEANLKVSEVDKLIYEAELIVEFLKYSNADENNFALAKDMKLDGPLQDLIPQYKKSIKNSTDKDDILAAMFAKIYQLRSKISKEDDYKTSFRPLAKKVIGKKSQNKLVDQLSDSADSISMALEVDKDGSESKVQSMDDAYARINNDHDAVEAMASVQEKSAQIIDTVTNEEQKNEPAKLIYAALQKMKAVDVNTLKELSNNEGLKQDLRDIQFEVNEFKKMLEE